jgi:hypothetical protein
MIIRVRLTNTTVPEDIFLFDLMVDEFFMPLPEYPYFGYCGALNHTEDGYGVLLTADGVIDLGSLFSGDSRYHKTNLRQRKMVAGEYITIWVKFSGPAEEVTYRIDRVVQLSSVTPLVSFSKATQRSIQTVRGLPVFRARTVNPIVINGFDNTTYRPPIGTLGDIVRTQDTFLFYPDDAVAKNGQMIHVPIDPNDVQLIVQADE